MMTKTDLGIEAAEEARDLAIIAHSKEIRAAGHTNGRRTRDQVAAAAARAVRAGVAYALDGRTLNGALRSDHALLTEDVVEALEREYDRRERVDAEVWERSPAPCTYGRHEGNEGANQESDLHGVRRADPPGAARRQSTVRDVFGCLLGRKGKILRASSSLRAHRKRRKLIRKGEPVHPEAG